MEDNPLRQNLGNVTLEAPSSAITGYNDGDGTTVGTVSGPFSDEFQIQLGLPAVASSPVTEYTYQCLPSNNDPTFCLVQTRSLADGLATPSAGLWSSCSYFNSTSLLQESYTYVNGNGGGVTGSDDDGYSATIYPLATDTSYTTATSTISTADSPTAPNTTPTTSYSYTYYSGTLQPESIVTTLPVVYSQQNGSGVAAKTVDFYDANGNLTWTKDGRGFLTENIDDPTSGLLMESIQDVDTSLRSFKGSGVFVGA